MAPEKQRPKYFPKKTIKEILRNNGFKQIMNGTVDLVNEVISKISNEIALGAIKLTRLKGVKTIKNEAIKISAQDFIGRNLDNLEVKLFTNGQIRIILEQNAARRISSESLDYLNELISKTAEDIALDAAKLIHSRGSEIDQGMAIKLSTKKFLGVQEKNENNIYFEEGI